MSPHQRTLALCVLAVACEKTTAEPSSAQPDPASAKGGPAAAGEPEPARLTPSLAEARRGFQTKLVRPSEPGEPAETPPADSDFRLVHFEAPPGPLAAYLTKDPGDGARHPAIVWITGGETNTIGDVWVPGPPDDEQSASAYRKAGIVMMFPSQRGGNTNPGRREGFMGEVDDVLAAADYLAKIPYVDADRIYLGGHSTGGTLALLVAEVSDRFRSVFAFGPVHNVAGYGEDMVYCDASDRTEMLLRSPFAWLGGIRSPVFVFEGTEDGNADALEIMRALSKNDLVQFHLVEGADHFSILDPVNELIAKKITRDTNEAANLTFSRSELDGLFTPAGG